ncbi:cbb3-type cytochrome oxidase subunit 3 [Rhizobium binae]|uniref:Cbb3-type cytochrome oxidase subunit 3 n=1 Tax=Rhizobium binae TaxID=1138190 RepID=A0ABV2MAE6_9HYPH
METVSSPEVFLHIKVVMGMVISLSLARLLTGVAGIVQHPARAKVYPIHLGWALSLFLFIIHIWWWEYRLQAVSAIGFGIYLFLVCFCGLFFPALRPSRPGKSRQIWRLRGIFHIAAQMVLRHPRPDLCR